MDAILKFVLYTRKHPEKKLHTQFTAFNALNINRDFDWAHEESKAEYIRFLCTVDAPRRQVVKTFKRCKRQLCLYNEFYYLARRLIKDAKRGGGYSWRGGGGIE